MKHYLLSFFVILFLFEFFTAGFSNAQTPTPTSSPDTQALIKQLQSLVASLQKQIFDLQTQLKTARGEIQEVKAEVKELKLTRPVAVGAKGDDIRELQEFLKQYPEIYPEGLVTGFFGPATESAIKRFQEKNGIESLGIVGPKTIAKINALITEGTGKSGQIPSGLLRVPGIQKKLGTTTEEGVLPPMPTPAGTIPAIPAQPIGQTGTTTIPAISAVSATTTIATTTGVTPPSTPVATPTGTTPPPSTMPLPPVTTPPPSTGTSTTTTTAPPPSPTPSPSPPPSPPATPIAHTCGQPVNVPQETPSIQAALNAACSGDTVYVGVGTYRENLIIQKSRITLKGASGTTADQVFIDGGMAGNGIATGPAVTDTVIDGMTVQNGRTASGIGTIYTGILINPATYQIGCVCNAGNTIIRNMIAKGNGNGIEVRNVWNGTVTIERNLLIGNFNSGIEGGVIKNGSMIITNNTIANNGRGYSDWSGGGSRIFKNNIIVSNGSYGAYFNQQSGRTILYNNTWGNTKGNYYYGDLYSNPFSFVPSPGTGELFLDPKFISSTDYHLQSSSSMINAGDPSLTDPDGSRSDMGAYYFSGSTPPSPSPTPTPPTLATTTVTGTLSISKSDTVSAGNVSIDTNVDLGAFSFQAQTESIEISSLRLKLVIPAAEDGTQIDAVTIVDQNGTIVAGSIDVGADETVTLANIWTVPVGAQTYKIKGRLTTDFEDGDTVAVSLTPNTDITAKGVTSGTGITVSPSSAVLTNTLTVHRSVNTSAPSSSSTTASTTGMMEKINAFAAMLQSVKTLLQMLQSIAK